MTKQLGDLATNESCAMAGHCLLFLPSAEDSKFTHPAVNNLKEACSEESMETPLPISLPKGMLLRDWWPESSCLPGMLTHVSPAPLKSLPFP